MAAKKNRSRSSSSKGNQPLTVADLNMRFHSCGRCGLFLAVYRLEADGAAIEQALAEVESDWLVLPWEPAMRDLVLRAYGQRIHNDNYYYTGICPECRRRFVFSEASEEEPARFEIQV